MTGSRVHIARFLVLLLMATTALLAADYTLGTWQLNLRKSRFLPGPAFKSETRTYAEEKDGVKVTIRTVDGKGRQATSVYLSTPDGKQHSVSGSGGPADAVALKRIDEYTAETTLIHADREIAKTTRTVSADGMTLTITYKGLDPDGNQVNNTLIFDRVK